VLSTESLDTDGTDFFNIPLIKTICDLKRFSVLNQSPHYNLKKDQDFFTRMNKLGELLLLKKDVSNREELLEGLSYKQKLLFYLTFVEFFQIQITNSLCFDIDQPIPFMKDCLIGFEGCVNVDGSISICYKADTFIIGSVIKNTWYLDKIDEFHKKRYKLPECKYCYVQRFCKFCYDKINGKEDQFKNSIKNYCEFTRYYYRVIFEYMLKIMENNPNLWDELQKDAENEYLERKRLEDKSIETRN
jgi:sulfatase maturation enzyme AslB (radical SAM superfamily)